ncbi:MAG: hypothetical protein HYT48_03205 [Candidatus Vogelbacteria bacterium]|nr:hypothetical protein [Candidatus Vogelbacteria bacterium]
MATLADKKINFALKNLVVKAVSDTLSDPDYGLKVKPSFARKLLSAQRSSSRGISLATARKKYL